MPNLDWNVFASLPGDPPANFEQLWRVLVRRHYARFGRFRALAQQPGVEFHLELHSSCDLGDAGRWYGWQCKWYSLPPGRPLGSARRSHIRQALSQTTKHLPNLTDWVLCTRFALTPSDQQWLEELPKTVRLHLWTAHELDDHLAGPGEIYRGTYFGDLVLTPDVLRRLHESSAASIRTRWRPAVHQALDAERTVRRALGAADAWPDVHGLATQLASDLQDFRTCSSHVPASLRQAAADLAALATDRHQRLVALHEALVAGAYDECQLSSASSSQDDRDRRQILRGLRSRRHSLALEATNLVANFQDFDDTLHELAQALATPLLAVVAAAGCGKTQLAAQLTAPTADRPAGILLYGRDLQAGHGLDVLARRVTLHGRPFPSFEALVAAVDSAGRRAARRIPIVIDGLNEAEDPREWVTALAAISVRMRDYPYALLVCTLRGEFRGDTLPDGIETVEMAGFQEDIREAVARYFGHYRIERSDTLLPWRLLNHPLTLRMFCEVTNPTRMHMVGAEAMPTCLTALFDRYLDQVADRVALLSSRTTRFCQADVWQALEEIGRTLWESVARQIEVSELRALLDGPGGVWHASIVRALEEGGVLFRVRDPRDTRGACAVEHDALAGHLIGDWLCNQFGSHEFDSWFTSTEIQEKLVGRGPARHPLASDILGALAGLLPRRRPRRHLWPLLQGASRADALCEAARLEGKFLDRETVSGIREVIRKGNTSAGSLFYELRSTRAAVGHPLNADFLDTTLRDMTNADRDLCWTEWIRTTEDERRRDVDVLERRWDSATAAEISDEGEILRARWVMWTLTSTIRPLRDRATRALYRFGSAHSGALFRLTLDALAIADPYVSERMLAACYGVAMTLWADPARDDVRSELMRFGVRVYGRVLSFGGPSRAAHALMRDYATGIVELAARIRKGRGFPPGLASGSGMVGQWGTSTTNPFRSSADIADKDVTQADGAIHMDFGNYTIGRLVPNRSNYDYKNETYGQVRRQIEARLVELGFSKARFQHVERQIVEEAWRWRRHQSSRTDRYGKKYAWIAYFEMYGVRRERGLLAEWQRHRPSDVDVDPSFPNPPREWAPKFCDVFDEAPREPHLWMQSGAVPNYDDALFRQNVDGHSGPWALLEGYVERVSSSDDRRIFSFLRDVFVRHWQVGTALHAFETLQYPGNFEIPEPMEDHYVYAGEIPWSVHYGGDLRRQDGTPRPDRRRAFEGQSRPGRDGVLVEVPVCRFAWESYHCELNQVGGVDLPTPRLCEVLALTNRQGEWDFRDRDDEVGTLYRECGQDWRDSRSRLAYIRADLLVDYLKRTGQRLVWFVWGERTLRYGALERLGGSAELRKIYRDYKHIHARWRVLDSTGRRVMAGA